MRPLPFVQFLDRVCGVTLEPAQRIYWGTFVDGVQPADMAEPDRELGRNIFGEIDEVSDDARTVGALVKGADIGASFIGGLWLLYCALTSEGDWARGEIRPALCVGPDLRLSRIPVRTARSYAERIPAIAAMIESASSDSIVFRREGGRLSSVECLPASVGGRATRGRRYLAVLLDEASFFREESTGQVNDVHVYQSVIVRCTGQVLLASTPWLETNLIWKLFEENFGHPSTALAARMPTLLVRTNDRTRKMVERERTRDPDLAAQEYDCEPFGAGAAQFFGADVLEAALDRGLSPLPALEPLWTATIAADLGLVKDSTAAVALHSHRDGRIVMADSLEFRPKRGKPLRLSEVIPQICQLAGRHGAHIILCDHHMLSEARLHCLPGYTLRAIPGGQDQKARRHVRARTLFKEGRVRIPGAFARVITQLGDVVAKPQPGGGTLIQQARRRGTHGDLAAALIVALGDVAKPGRYAEWCAMHAHETPARAALRADAAERSAWAELSLSGGIR